MAATAQQLEPEMSKKNKAPKAAPPTGKKKVKAEKAAPPKAEKKAAKAKRKWMPPPDEWRTVLRLPTKLANKLKKASSKNNMSVNNAVKTLVEVWTKSEKV